jgi:hypothetical protein
MSNPLRPVVVIAALLVTWFPTASVTAEEPTAAEKAFDEYAGWIAGGTWSATDAAGKKYEYKFERILGNKFLRLSGKEGDLTFEETIGIDPRTGKWSSWGFDTKGTVWQGETEIGKAGEWTFHLAGKAKSGEFSWKMKETKLEANKTRREILEYIEDGKKQPAEVMIWTRKR